MQDAILCVFSSSSPHRLVHTPITQFKKSPQSVLASRSPLSLVNYHMSRQNPAVLDDLARTSHPHNSHLHQSHKSPHTPPVLASHASNSKRQSLVMTSLIRQSLAANRGRGQVSIVELASKGGASHRTSPNKPKTSPKFIKVSSNNLANEEKR